MTYYVSLEEYLRINPNGTEATYNHFAWDAQRYLDNATAGVDGVKKLAVAFPTNEDDAETVKRCMCALIDTLDEINQIKSGMISANGYVSTSAGLISKSVKSVSAGGESISYGADGSTETDVVRAAKSNSELKSYVFGVIRHYLDGICDDNGVFLLYGGRYPREYL